LRRARHAERFVDVVHCERRHEVSAGIAQHANLPIVIN
jgi:hypothetical protein